MTIRISSTVIPRSRASRSINTLSTFANETGFTTEMRLIHIAVLIIITLVYTLILTKTLPKKTMKGGYNNE